MVPAASIRDRRSRSHAPSSADHRLLISGFLPMPPISASPVCTPTVAYTDEFVPESTPSDLSEADVEHLLLHVPTWIATPPTPTKNVRRSVTCAVRRPPSPLSSSGSLPAGAGPSGWNSTRRRLRASSDSSLRRPAFTRSDEHARLVRVPSPESDLGSEPDSAWDTEKAKDDVRKYHALVELLTTEVSYLSDLRALFSIYLRNLSTLCRTHANTFGRGTSSRTNSYTHLPKPSVLSDQALHPLTTIHAKPKPSTRLFTDREIDLLTRNAEEVLQLHENFVEELRAAVLPLGFPMEISGTGGLDERELIRNIDAAVGRVSTKFATETSRFEAYQSFCVGHTEALQLVHRAQHQYPLEWDAYEQHCASLIASMDGDGQDSRPESIRSSSDGEDRQHQPFGARHRTASLTSLDNAVRKVRSRTHSKQNSLDGRRSHRLTFLDYMIKPIQRICKYPLLLDQLRPGKTLRAMPHHAIRPHMHVVVESAAQAMRHVASAVDEARHRQDVKMQSSLIISRITLAHPALATSHMSSAYPAFQILTPSFLSSLGTCLLAGSLDVMHYQSSKSSSSGANINAKYLGAFLYLGGYLILVKVKGKIYEPKHWFPLVDFTVVDLEEEDMSLPCTFSLTCNGHQFDLTAACLREKDAWLSSIHEARLHPPSWINEPTPSIHCDGKGELVPSTLDGPFEVIHALPTIQSLPELAKEDFEPELTDSILNASQSQAPKPDIPCSKAEPVASRRSSTASVKAIFSANSDTDTIVIRRSSPAARLQVDQGLQDVISEPVLAARLHASRKDELFQAPKGLRASTSFGRSTSALSLTRLSRHESVRIPRKKSFADDGIFTKSSSSRGGQKRRPKKLSIVSTSEAESIFPPPSDSASPFSQCSSLVSGFASPTESPAGSEEHAARSRRPSLANNAPSLSTSPVSSPAPSPRSTASDHYKTLTQGILKHWSFKGSRHRRAKSAQNDQNVPLAAALGDSSEQSPVEFGAALSLVMSPPEDPGLRPPSPHADLSRSRLLSSGAPITFRHSSADNTSSKRNSIFKRLKGID